MPVFCAEFAWCSPHEFRAMTLKDYRRLREYLVQRAEASR